MVHLKNNYMIQLVIILDFTLSFSSFIPANAEYKVVSFKGKVKIKKDDEVFPLKKQLRITL